ncbi:MAG: ABC transporter ATP-binding protein [Myxococcales bacterium]|jgi:ABC-2 type transport system ATP-binding protein
MIVVDQVSKYYGAHRAVADLAFEIGQGECVGFLGLNGAGKTTTLRLLSCLLLPTSGRITVRGLDVVEHPHEIRRLIGYLPDTPPLYGEMTVEGYLLYAGRLRGLSGAGLREGLDRALSLCALGEVPDAIIATLSHGYRQRVGIAQAIIHRPALLILDEPIQGLDPVQIVEMRKMIGELRGEHTILLSTHILSEIEQTCDRILMMDRGRIAAEGTEQELAGRLGGGAGLRLRLRGAADAARAALQAVSGVVGLQVKPLRDGLLEVSLRVPDDAREQVSRAVVDAGLGLLEMQQVTTGLEEVFLKLSHGAPASGEQGGGDA